MVVSDLLEGINHDTMRPLFAAEHSEDVKGCLALMDEFTKDGVACVDFPYSNPTIVLPFVLHDGKEHVDRMLGKDIGKFAPQPYLAASQAIYDAVFMKQGNTAWMRLNSLQNVSESLRGLCEQWNVAVSLAKEAYAFPDAVVMAQNAKCDPATVGMLAGSRFGLQCISGKWVFEVPVDTKRIIGRFVACCMNNLFAR